MEGVNTRNSIDQGLTSVADGLMDLTVPGGMGGKETIEHLKKLDPNLNYSCKISIVHCNLLVYSALWT